MVESAPPLRRPLLSAELLSIGTELTVGETVDTNAGDVARSLTSAGVRVGRVVALPDDLAVVTDALREAVGRADLVVTTGGLGPTPDDLTREAVAGMCGETPVVDPDLLAWLRGLWDRRGMPFPDGNTKQAWVIPSATPLPNPNGTAPGWWVERPDGRVIVTLPGPPREMRPMWADEVLPRLAARGVGVAMVVRTLRLTGIGESQVAERLGGLLLAANPVVATYARVEAVDVRISAVDEAPGAGPGAAARRSATEMADAAEAHVLAAIGGHVWARGATTWAEAVDAALAARGWTLATSERGTDGALVALLGGGGRVRRSEVLADDAPVPGADVADGAGGDDGAAAGGDARATAGDDGPLDALAALAEAIRTDAGSEVGLAIRARPRGDDTGVSIAIATPNGRRRERRLAFLQGRQGRHRAAIAAAAVLLEALRNLQAAD